MGLLDFHDSMENLMVIRVEVIAPEKPSINKHLQKYRLCSFHYLQASQNKFYVDMVSSDS